MLFTANDLAGGTALRGTLCTREGLIEKADSPQQALETRMGAKSAELGIGIEVNKVLVSLSKGLFQAGESQFVLLKSLVDQSHMEGGDVLVLRFQNP